MTSPERPPAGNYWRANLKLIAILLAIWAFVSFGLGIYWAEDLHDIHAPLPGTPLGFWFAQQGSIFTFVILIWVYSWRMNRLDDEYFSDDGDQ
ncbi:MAG: DUF4212 domain-containing protein [Planctomycetota bacterium]|nr:DUF4212 domain-containing protein [Planctomycetota bacterium]